MDIGMFSPPGGGRRVRCSIVPLVIRFSVTRAGGRAWSTAALYQPLILLHPPYFTVLVCKFQTGNSYLIGPGNIHWG